MNKILMSVGLGIFLAGCSSAHDDQLELLAANRASLLQAQLPIEQGPLSIMRASSNANVIEIMMVYNRTSVASKTAQQVMADSIRGYCVTQETQNNLKAGLAYRLKIRNSRGQLMLDKFVDEKTCEKLTPTTNSQTKQ